MVCLAFVRAMTMGLNGVEWINIIPQSRPMRGARCKSTSLTLHLCGRLARTISIATSWHGDTFRPHAQSWGLFEIRLGLTFCRIQVFCLLNGMTFYLISYGVRALAAVACQA